MKTIRGALKIKKIQKVQTLAEPPLPPPSPLHGSVKPIFFSYRRSTPSPFQRSSVTTIFFIKDINHSLFNEGRRMENVLDTWKMEIDQSMTLLTNTHHP